MGRTDTEVRTKLTAVDSASKIVQTVTGEITKMSKGMTTARDFTNGLGVSFDALQNPAMLAGQAIRKAGEYIFEAAQLAGDFNETVSKVGVIFGNSAGDIEEYANDAAVALGQTRQAAMDAAATFATFGKAAGLTDDDLVDFSTTLTSLSSDLASFHNTSPEDAVLALGAALRGESEPIRRYGVLLDDATLRQKALEMGIIDTVKEALTPQQKALASYQVILDQTADAQGDFERTSDGMANQQRILEAQFEDLKIKIGERYSPAVTEATKLTNKLVEAMTDLVDTGNRNAEVIDNVRRAFAMGLITQDEYADALRGVKTGQWELNEAAEDASTIMENLDAAMSDTTLETGSLSNAFKDKLVPALEDTEEAAIDVESVMKKYTTELLYNKAAAGLDAEAALGLARALGLVDERTAFMLEEVDELKIFFDLNKNGFIDAGMEADAYNTAIKQLDASLKELPSNIPVNVNVTVSGPGANLINPGSNIGTNIQAYAEGGSFMTNGPQLIMVGDNPGGVEQVSVTPISSGSGGGGTVNNWNISMSTNAPTSTIARDLQYLSGRAI